MKMWCARKWRRTSITRESLSLGNWLNVWAFLLFAHTFFGSFTLCQPFLTWCWEQFFPASVLCLLLKQSGATFCALENCNNSKGLSFRKQSKAPSKSVAKRLIVILWKGRKFQQTKWSFKVGRVTKVNNRCAVRFFVSVDHVDDETKPP